MIESHVGANVDALELVLLGGMHGVVETSEGWRVVECKGVGLPENVVALFVEQTADGKSGKIFVERETVVQFLSRNPIPLDETYETVRVALLARFDIIWVLVWLNIAGDAVRFIIGFLFGFVGDTEGCVETWFKGVSVGILGFERCVSLEFCQ